MSYFEEDSIITTIQLLDFRNFNDDMEDCSLEELSLCAYIDGLPISNYMKAVVENEYEWIRK